MVQVVLTNFKMDVPRNSFSQEMYTFNSKYVRMLLPVDEAQLERMKPTMDGCVAVWTSWLQTVSSFMPNDLNHLAVLPPLLGGRWHEF